MTGPPVTPSQVPNSEGPGAPSFESFISMGTCATRQPVNPLFIEHYTFSCLILNTFPHGYPRLLYSYILGVTCPCPPGAKHRHDDRSTDAAPGSHGSQPRRRPPRLDTHPRHAPRRATGRPEERLAEGYGWLLGAIFIDPKISRKTAISSSK
jgi:hypothetical protein